MRRLEEEQEQEERRRRQIESKQLYETNLRLKLKKKAREEQEQLAFDMKVLEALLEETANEAAEMAQRKVSDKTSTESHMEITRHQSQTGTPVNPRPYGVFGPKLSSMLTFFMVQLDYIYMYKIIHSFLQLN